VSAVRPEAILLDFDGLICDTERIAHLSWQELYAEHGLEFPDRVWRAMAGRADGERVACADLAGRLGVRDVTALAARRRRRKRELCAGEPLRPGVLALLDAAARHRVPAAVVSSSPHDWVGPHLTRLGVLGHFALVINGDMTARHKPHPDLYELALARLGTSARGAVAFEDSAVGVRAAQAAGLRCVAVPSAVADPAELAHADVVLHSLADHELVAGTGGAEERNPSERTLT
jgi:HAD superfamily hydrolase (TIGR01509 family)